MKYQATFNLLQLVIVRSRFAVLKQKLFNPEVAIENFCNRRSSAKEGFYNKSVCVYNQDQALLRVSRFDMIF